MDIVDPPDGAFWGKFNNRVLDQSWVKNLTETFATNLDNCTMQTAVDVAIDPEWLQDKTTILRTVEGLDIEEVPKMMFSAEGSRAIKKNNLWMLGGNHRRVALTALRDKMAEDIEEMNNAIESVEEEVRERGEQILTDEQRENLDHLKEEVLHLEGRLNSSSMWVVRLYDRGERPDGPTSLVCLAHR